MAARRVHVCGYTPGSPRGRQSAAGGLGLGLGLVVAVRWWGAGEGSGEGAQPPLQQKKVLR